MTAYKKLYHLTHTYSMPKLTQKSIHRMVKRDLKQRHIKH